MHIISIGILTGTVPGVPGKSHVSRFYNSVYSHPILDYNISNSRSKHLQSENDKIKPVSEFVSELDKLSYSVWLLLHLVLTLSQI